MTAQEEPTEPISGLTQVVCERIVAELAPGAGNRILRCLRTAESLVGAAGAAPSSLRLAASAVYNLREALDTVVTDRPAGEGGFSAAIDAWDRYTTASALPGADEVAARAALAATMDELARTRNRQAYMTRRLLEWFREQTGVDPIPGDTDPVAVYQELRDRTSRVVHDDCSFTAAQSLFAETVAWFERFFTPPSEIAPRIEKLAAQPFAPRWLAELRSLATSSHHIRLFLERLQDPDWLQPLRAAELIKLPEPQSPWPVAVLTGPNRQLPDERVVELLVQLLSDVQALDKADRPAPSFEIMRNAVWLGPAGHGVVVAVLRQYPTEEWAHMMAMSAASDLDDSDPLHLAVADAVIGNESRHDGGYRTKLSLAHLIDGVTPTNVRERYELLAHKCRRLASSERAKYVVTDVTALTVDGWDDGEPLVLAANALARLVATARDMGVPNSWMLELVSLTPGEWGERLECQVLAGANEIGRKDKVAHLVRRLRSETATGDDRLLLDDLSPFTSEEILELRAALGQPAPPPPSLDRDPLGANWARAWRWSMILPAGALVGWEDAIAAVAELRGQPDPTAMDRPLRNPIVSHGSSPYPYEQLVAMEPLAAAELAAVWRPSADDAWGVSARELARSIESVVKDDPVAWTVSAAEIVRVLREPVYIDHYLRGLKASVAKLPPSSTPSLLQAVALIRAERWPPTTLGRDDYDYEADWTGVDSAVVELIGALADRDADLDDHLDQCWKVAGEAASDLPEDHGSVGSYADAARHDDPLHGAINSSYGRGFQAQLALGGWEHRKLGAASHRLVDALAAATSVDGAVGQQLRAVISATRPFVESIAADWMDRNFEELFGGRSGRLALAQSLKYSRPTPAFYARSFELLLGAARRNDDNAVAWLLIAHLWDEPGYTYDAIVNGLRDSPSPRSTLADEVARLGQGLPDDQREVTERAVAFSRRLIADAGTRIRPEDLTGLGRWAMASELDTEGWLELTEGTVAKTGGQIAYAVEVADRCSKVQPSSAALRILLAVLGHGDAWEQHHIDGVALEALRSAADGGIDDEAFVHLRERLIQRGRHEATNIRPQRTDDA